MRYSVDLTNDEIAILEHDLLDVNQWIQAAIQGKLNASRKRLVDEATTALRRDPTVTTIPTDDAALIAAYRARPEYRNRAQRDDAARQRQGIDRGGMP